MDKGVRDMKEAVDNIISIGKVVTTSSRNVFYI